MITRRANCKINIGLHILRRRDDGYHDLSTVMYPVVGLYDVVGVESTDGDEVVFCSSGIEIDCATEDNICVKAARLMQQRYGVGGVKISLTKNIPFGAGLGGGSADGTAVIMAIDELYGLQLSEALLIDCAAALGSDTAFFVRNTPQLCTGRGEVMTPISLSLPEMWIVLIKPDVHISTREAYSGVVPHLPATPLEQLILKSIEQWQELIANDFERSIFSAHPELAAIKAHLLEQGAIYAAMSGSGSTIYGLFETEEEARKLSPLTPYIYNCPAIK